MTAIVQRGLRRLTRRRPVAARGLRSEGGRYWSLHQLGLVGLATAGAALFVAALQSASNWTVGPAVWLLVPVPVLLLRVVDSAWPLAYWAVMLYVWIQATPAGSFTWWSVPAGGGLILAHAATALGASAPPAAEIPAIVGRVWLGRVLLALAAAVAVAGAVHLLEGRVAAFASAAYVIGLLGVAGLLWVTRSKPPDTRD